MTLCIPYRGFVQVTCEDTWGGWYFCLFLLRDGDLQAFVPLICSTEQRVASGRPYLCTRVWTSVFGLSQFHASWTCFPTAKANTYSRVETGRGTHLVQFNWNPFIKKKTEMVFFWGGWNKWCNLGVWYRTGMGSPKTIIGAHIPAVPYFGPMLSQSFVFKTRCVDLCFWSSMLLICI